ncbi:hypothetical protein CTAYLR_009746 [Chrysophaeum taylorii]|uniref:Hexose transporter 1 n=1 Tax=Chrysophaeum taylorii TaxID=2483200 RepID=A0AAD7XNY6_9STRA|nr:hypothetical protein CTAYLR_009746 [Chrysophaeum taylorii]
MASWSSSSAAEERGSDDESPPALKKIDNWRDERPVAYVYVLAGIAALNSANLGYDIGVMSGAAVYVQRAWHLNNWRVEVLIGILNFCSIGGALAAHVVNDWMGRRRTFQCTCVIFVCGVAGMTFSPTYAVLLAFRVVTGIGVGMGLSIDPVYIAEIAPKQFRGELVSWSEISINFGILLGFVTSYAFRGFRASISWRLMLGCGVVAPLVLLALTVFVMPESPRWLVANDREAEAREVLARLTRPTDDREAIILEIREALRTERCAVADWATVLRPRSKADGRALAVGVGVAAAQQLMAEESLLFYLPRILGSMQVDDRKIFLALIAMGILKTSCIVVSACFLDTRGRRPMLLVSVAGMAASLASIALSMLYAFEWGTVVAIWCYMMSFSLGLGPICWLVASEVFPLSVRAKGMALATCANRFFAAAIATSFLTWANAMPGRGYSQYFWFFAAVAAVIWVLLYIFVPETKGKSLEEMRVIFSSSEKELDHHLELPEVVSVPGDAHDDDHAQWRADSTRDDVIDGPPAGGVYELPQQQSLGGGGSVYELPQSSPDARETTNPLTSHKLTLSFSDQSLEAEWSRLVEPRQRALWLRSLLSSVLFQALRHAADLVEFGGQMPRTTLATRLLLSVAELTLYALARVELIAPRQAWIATNATLYGMVELALVCRHLAPRVRPSAWLFVTYGVAWFVVPKMSALQFFPACCGSMIIVAWWLSLSLATTRAGRRLLGMTAVATSYGGGDCESGGVACARRVLAALEEQRRVATSWCDITAGLALTVPVIVLFNVVAYSSEKSVKERFVLRSALSHEHNHDVRLALLSAEDPFFGRAFLEKVKLRILRREPAPAEDAGEASESSTSSNVSPRRAPRFPKKTHHHSAPSKSGGGGGTKAAAERAPFFSRGARGTTTTKPELSAALAIVPCAMLAALGWFPSAQRLTSRLVMESLGGVDAAWAALTHVAGLTLLVLVLTRQLRFVILTPLVCLSLLWLTAQLWEVGAPMWWLDSSSAIPSRSRLDAATLDFCERECGGLGSPRGDRLFYWEQSDACGACFAESASIKASPDRDHSLALALRLVGSVVLVLSFLYALGLFAKCVRLFARLVAFARRTLFLYPHLVKDLVGPSSGGGDSCSKADSEMLKKLISSDRLPRLPGGPAAVCCAIDGKPLHDEKNNDRSNARARDVDAARPPSAAIASSDDTEDDHRPRRGGLPLLAIGATPRACSFCSRDGTTGKSRLATHSIPVCSDWARWYLWRAEIAERAQRLKSEIGVADGSIVDTVERPCCDFSSLALERASLAADNQALRARVAILEASLASCRTATTTTTTNCNTPPAGVTTGRKSTPQ